MAIIEDSRNKPGQHEAKNRHFEESGEFVHRCKLPVGDYMRPSSISIDTKKDIKELAQDLIQDWARFRRECELAQRLGVQLVVLVENTEGVTSLAELREWVEDAASFNMRKKRHPNARRTHGSFLVQRCEKLHEDYGTWFGFCSPQEAGRRVIEILDKGEEG